MRVFGSASSETSRIFAFFTCRPSCRAADFAEIAPGSEIVGAEIDAAGLRRRLREKGNVAPSRHEAERFGPVPFERRQDDSFRVP